MNEIPGTILWFMSHQVILSHKIYLFYSYIGNYSEAELCFMKQRNGCLEKADNATDLLGSLR